MFKRIVVGLLFILGIKISLNHSFFKCFLPEAFFNIKKIMIYHYEKFLQMPIPTFNMKEQQFKPTHFKHLNPWSHPWVTTNSSYTKDEGCNVDFLPSGQAPLTHTSLLVELTYHITISQLQCSQQQLWCHSYLIR